MLSYLNNNMEKIYIGFSTHIGNLLSKTIQIIENTNYSHVYIRKVSKYGEYIYQASGLAVNFTNIDIFKKHNIIIEEYEFNLTNIKMEKTISFMMKHAGDDYELKELFELLIILLGNRFQLNVKFSSSGNDKFICSKLAALFCKEILEIPIDQSEINFITPKQLNPIIKMYGKQIV